MRKVKNKKRITITRKTLLVSLLLIITISAAGFTAYALINSNNDLNKTKSDDDSPAINYEPPTEEEKKENDQYKDDLVRRMEDQKTNQPNTQRTVTPIIGFWGQNQQNKDVEVSVPSIEGVYEEGGICTLVLQMQSNKVQQTKQGIKDATTTTCGIITIPRSSLTPGSWEATVHYSSSTSQGKSKSVSISIE